MAKAVEKRPRHDLTRKQIVDAALTLADREGIDAVTMRRLAAELSVGTMTVYGYFRSKDELLDEAMDRGAEEVKIPPRRGSWRTQLRALAVEMFRALTRHPAAPQLRFRRPLISPGMMRITNAGMRILREAGFDSTEAARAWRLLFVWMFGLASFTPTDASAAQIGAWKAYLASLPEEEFPWVVESASELVESTTGENQFEQGLERLLDALEASLRETSP